MPKRLVAIAVFALIDETTQPFFGRAAEPWDWFADVVGGAAGLGLAAWFVVVVRAIKLMAALTDR